jgi:hypothetical protein
MAARPFRCCSVSGGHRSRSSANVARVSQSASRESRISVVYFCSMFFVHGIALILPSGLPKHASSLSRSRCSPAQAFRVARPPRPKRPLVARCHADWGPKLDAGTQKVNGPSLSLLRHIQWLRGKNQQPESLCGQVFRFEMRQ